MLASKQFVKDFVYSAADMKGSELYRRYWCDKAKDAGKRNLTFRFWSKQTADDVAQKLELALFVAGYKNKVKRTRVERNFTSYSEGGEYVRVQVVL